MKVLMLQVLMLTATCLAAAVMATPALGQSTGISAGTADELAGKQPVKAPPPPRLPRSFDAKGRYIVRDLDVDVPFTWRGKGGDSQMIAGGKQYPIYFTNIISGGYLYTLTYKWPGIARRPCSRVGPFTLGELNKFLESSRYVGAETLDDSKPHHFGLQNLYDPELDEWMVMNMFSHRAGKVTLPAECETVPASSSPGGP
jgi:hypothetical protein